jgi:hypothetical protein
LPGSITVRSGRVYWIASSQGVMTTGTCDAGSCGCPGEICGGLCIAASACAHGCIGDPARSCKKCTPGETRCHGVTPQTCDSNGAFVDGPQCPSTCVDGRCVDGPCTSGQTRCQGNATEACAGDGGWVPAQACGNDVCSNGVCVRPRECDNLLSCCSQLSTSIQRTTCTNVARGGAASGCQSTLDGYRSGGLCF